MKQNFIQKLVLLVAIVGPLQVTGTDVFALNQTDLPEYEKISLSFSRFSKIFNGEEQENALDPDVYLNFKQNDDDPILNFRAGEQVKLEAESTLKEYCQVQIFADTISDLEIKDQVWKIEKITQRKTGLISLRMNVYFKSKTSDDRIKIKCEHTTFVNDFKVISRSIGSSRIRFELTEYIALRKEAYQEEVVNKIEEMKEILLSHGVSGDEIIIDVSSYEKNRPQVTINSPSIFGEAKFVLILAPVFNRQGMNPSVYFKRNSMMTIFTSLWSRDAEKIEEKIKESESSLARFVKSFFEGKVEEAISELK